jgi:hypothetical protein
VLPAHQLSFRAMQKTQLEMTWVMVLEMDEMGVSRKAL